MPFGNKFISPAVGTASVLFYCLLQMHGNFWMTTAECRNQKNIQEDNRIFVQKNYIEQYTEYSYNENKLNPEYAEKGQRPQRLL